jgi:hypothetical protein
MEDNNTPSVMTKLASFLFFIFFTTACFGWFFWSSFDTIHSLYSEAQNIAFSKGAMYSLGAGMTSLIIVSISAYQTLKKTNLSKFQEKLVTKLLILSIALMFLFPVSSHFLLEKIVVQKGYSECKEMSYQWLLYKKITYVKNNTICSHLIPKK